MVAEFFRRAGWEVLGGVGGAVPDPSDEVACDWFDAVGFTIGSELRVEWARQRIAAVRRLSRNRSIVVLVGGPLLDVDPAWAERLGADGSGHDGSDVAALADRLVAARAGPR
jgi:methanogenic corrinoid protein MtbC1